MLSLALIGVAGLVLLPAVAVASGGASGHKPVAQPFETVRLGYLGGLVVVLAVLFIGHVGGAHVKMLFVGDDKRLSTSKTIAAVWTIVVAAAILGAVGANLIDHPAPLKAMGASGIVGQYALLFGGPLGAAILAKQIVSGQAASAPKSSGTASLKDLIADDAGDTDLGDFQYVLFNLAALIFVISTLLHHPLSGLPHVPDVLLGLTSVSAAGYVSKKALVPTGTLAADLKPREGGPVDNINLVLSGFPSTQTTTNVWIWFGTEADRQLALYDLPLNDGEASHAINPPGRGIPNVNPVKVKVITEDGTLVKAGKFKYT